MQIKLYTIPITDAGEMQAEMNKFLKTHKVLDVVREMVVTQHDACWCFCVRYLETNSSSTDEKRKKIDYREVLEPDVFERFAKMRACRKTVATELAIPAYAIFTDEEMSKIVQLDSIDEKSLIKVPGIGVKKVEKYGKRIMELYQRQEVGTVLSTSANEVSAGYSLNNLK